MIEMIHSFSYRTPSLCSVQELKKRVRILIYDIRKGIENEITLFCFNSVMKA